MNFYFWQVFIAMGRQKLLNRLKKNLVTILNIC